MASPGNKRNIPDSAVPQGWLARRRNRFLKDVKKGRGVSADFFRRHGWLIVFFTVVILILIGMRYRTRIYMKQITDLNTELKEAQNEMIAEKSRYMSLIRETDMVELTRKYNLGLEFPLRPPYVLGLEATDSVAVPDPTQSPTPSPD